MYIWTFTQSTISIRIFLKNDTKHRKLHNTTYSEKHNTSERTKNGFFRPIKHMQNTCKTRFPSPRMLIYTRDISARRRPGIFIPSKPPDLVKRLKAFIISDTYCDSSFPYSAEALFDENFHHVAGRNKIFGREIPGAVYFEYYSLSPFLVFVLDFFAKRNRFNGELSAIIFLFPIQ